MRVHNQISSADITWTTGPADFGNFEYLVVYHPTKRIKGLPACYKSSGKRQYKLVNNKWKRINDQVDTKG